MTCGATKAPAESETPLNTTTPVRSLRMTTLAPGTRAPVGSRTWPRIVAFVFCAYTTPALGDRVGIKLHPIAPSTTAEIRRRTPNLELNKALLATCVRFTVEPPENALKSL